MKSKQIFTLAIAAELGIILFSAAVDGISLEALHTTTRFSGRLSLLVFSLIFLVYSTKQAARWVSDKPFLLFACVHGIHLVELLLYVNLSGVELIPIRLLGGFVAYSMIFVMPFFSSRRDDGKLSASAFQKIEVIYFGYLWLIFFLTYLPRVLRTLPNVGGSYSEHVTLFGWVIAMGILKVVLLVNGRKAT